MRITESRMIEVAGLSVQRNREDVARAANAVSSGVRVDRPSVDPTAWANGMRARMRDIGNAERGSNVATARERLAATDGALSGVGSVVSRARELAVQLANGTYGADERAGAAAEVEALREAALASANRRGPDGAYVLAGTETGAAPFGNDGVYVGNAVELELETREGQTSSVTVSGDVLTANQGVDIFAALDQLKTALEGNDQNGVQAVLTDLDTAIAQVAKARTEVGSKMSALDSARDAAEEFGIELARIIDREIGADPFAAASELAQFMTALDSSRAVASEIISIASLRG
jgi:flagellar hook-associated protein 3 FlgL